MARACGTIVGYLIWHFCVVVLLLFQIEGVMAAHALANTLPATPGDRGSQPAPPQATAKTYQNVFTYCRAVRHTHYAEASTPPGYTGPQEPAEVVAAVHADGGVWRCMSRNVYACNPGADGYACMQMNTAATPRPVFWRFCGQNPGNTFLPMSLIMGMASFWKCQGTTPVVTRLLSTDKRGYLAAAWYRVRPKERAPSP